METKDTVLILGAIGGGILLFTYLKPKQVYATPVTYPSSAPSFTQQPALTQQPAISYKDEHIGVSLPLDKMFNWISGIFNKGGEETTKAGINKTVTTPLQTSFANPPGVSDSMYS